MKPETTDTTYTILKPEKKIPPVIIFSQKALKWIDALIDAHETEIGFYGVVEADDEHYIYRVSDIFYPKHQVMNSATCEISKDGEEALMLWLISHGREEDIGKMMLWGHSHHTMGVFPSGQDDKQAMDRMENTQENVIRIIVNKEKLMSVSFFDYNQQVRFDHIKWKEEEVETKEVCVNMIQRINAVISGEGSEEDKIKKIDEIMYTDSESEKIKAKIEKLKIENVPSVVSVGWDNNYSNYGNFSRLSNFDPPGTRTRFVDLNDKSRRGKSKDRSDFPNESMGKYIEEEFDDANNIHEMVERWHGL